MAAGDVKADIQSIANNSHLTIQPASGEEYVIHNIFHASDVEITFYDGTNEITFDSDAGAGVWSGHFWHVTNVDYIRVKNTSGATQNIGYSGIQTK